MGLNLEKFTVVLELSLLYAFWVVDSEFELQNINTSARNEKLKIRIQRPEMHKISQFPKLT